MSPADVCEVMDFLIAQSWPMPQAETQRLLVERFGWTIEREDGEDFLVNSVSGLNAPDVSTGEVKGWSTEVGLNVTDRTGATATPESEAFLGDAFAVVVREGEARWGEARLRRVEQTETATWDVAGGAQVDATRTARVVRVAFSSPQLVALNRRAEEFGV